MSNELLVNGARGVKPPSVVAHADWGTNPKKRWFASARLNSEGVYEVVKPQLVGSPESLLQRLAREANEASSVLVGFDFPIGIPMAYADTDAVGVKSFPSLISELGKGEWAEFYCVAKRADEISPRRPFYPYRPGGTSQRHLLDGLGFGSMDQLLRVCEKATNGRPRACCLFWTLGGNQVGKAAISGWRDVLAPALADSTLDVALWPFEGKLEDLIQNRMIVVTETYPTEFYGHLEIKLDGSKTDQVA